MSAFRCPHCGQQIDPADRFCGGCGRALDDAGAGRPVLPAASWRCLVCAAAGLSAALPAPTTCPLCGGDATADREATISAERPVGVVPFKIGQAEAAAACRAWLGSGALRPRGFAARVVAGLRPLFLPYWQLSMACDAYWIADSDAVPLWGRSGWAPQFGVHKGSYSGVLVPADETLSEEERVEIGAFDVSSLAPLELAPVSDVPTARVTCSRARLREAAVTCFEPRVRAACAELVPGRRHRGLRVNIMVRSLTARLIWVPVWLSAGAHRDRRWRCVINGRSGAVVGWAQLAWPRVIGTLLLFALLLVLAVLLYLRPDVLLPR